MARDDRRMTFIVVPQGGAELSTRSFELTYRRLRLALAAAVGVGLLLVVMATSWFYVAAQAARVPLLKREVSNLRRENQRVEQLSRAVVRLEAELRQIHLMMGTGAADSARARAGAATPDTAGGDSAAPDTQARDPD
ncbi:MAG TPA: hypothetical protein VFX98_15205 [Longimicrobiaceae bacterium]|nr:hypothetical protein [Longimicrobiaceae bacterium]